LKTALTSLEQQMRRYAKRFLKTEYGSPAIEKMKTIEIKAIDAYDFGGLSEATEKDITIAAKRDVNAGKLTGTTKLILRHEIGHVLDEGSPMFPEFEEELLHEEIAWQKAKLRNGAENWYKNLSVRTHVDPLKMQALGFPRPELKIKPERLRCGTKAEVERMGKSSVFVDTYLAERFAMVNLIENPDYYCKNS